MIYINAGKSINGGKLYGIQVFRLFAGLVRVDDGWMFGAIMSKQPGGQE